MNNGNSFGGILVSNLFRIFWFEGVLDRFGIEVLLELFLLFIYYVLIKY